MEAEYCALLILASFLIFSDGNVATAQQNLVLFPKPFFSSHLTASKELLKEQTLFESKEEMKPETGKGLEQHVKEEKYFQCTSKEAVAEEPSATPSIASTTEANACIYTPSETETSGCMPGWTSRNTSCYLLVHTQMTWEDAKCECHSYNPAAHLVFIENDFENEFVISFKESLTDVWLGLIKRKPGDWQWYDTPADIPEKVQQSLKISKEDRSPNCIRMKRSGQWDDNECTTDYFFICELEMKM